MAVINHNEAAPLGAVSIFRFTSFVERAFEGVRRWNSARVTARELRRLSNRQLEDIGVNPGEISEIANKLTSR